MGKFSDYGKTIITQEIKVLQNLEDLVDEPFQKAIELITEKAKRVCVTGMGKAGIIGQKIAATMASTGTKAFFMHPAEASHGDLGMIDKSDVIIALSNSGESAEMVSIIPSLKSIGSGIIAITGKTDSTLAKEADIVLEIGDIDEACPLGLAPTSSTTAMLALGDALALTLMHFNKDFDQNKYAFYHPGGSLGKKLLRVDEVMRKGEDCPILSIESILKDVLFAITKAKAGGAIIAASDGSICGFFADGDLRRAIEKDEHAMDKSVEEFMTKDPKSIHQGAFALEALTLMKDFMIGELPVADDNNKPVGVVSLKDLMSIGLLS